MTARCQCSVCRNPDGDPEVKGTHAARHAIFAAIVSEQPDWHFRRPSPREIAAWTAAEYDVPGTCPRREHAGAPAHPAHGT